MSVTVIQLRRRHVTDEELVAAWLERHPLLSFETLNDNPYSFCRATWFLIALRWAKEDGRELAVAP